MRVTFLLDDDVAPGDDPEFSGAWDPASPIMEHHVVHAAREAGHATRVVPLGGDVRAALRRVEATRPDVVFNLIEHYRAERRHAPHVATLLAGRGLRVTGCSAAAMALTADKAACTRIVAARGLRVPDTLTFPVGRSRPPRGLAFPRFVKPRHEDGSTGISLGSLVRGPGELAARVRYIHDRLAQDALCQEYLDGPEVSVGIIGTRRLRVLPPREMVFGGRRAGGPAFATERVKESKRYSEKWNVFYRRAELGPAVEGALARFAVRVYRGLGMTGYGRVDFRLDAAGSPVFLEANANPDIRPRTFGVMAQWAGLGYAEMIDLLLRTARPAGPRRRSA